MCMTCPGPCAGTQRGQRTAAGRARTRSEAEARSRCLDAVQARCHPGRQHALRLAPPTGLVDHRVPVRPQKGPPVVGVGGGRSNAHGSERTSRSTCAVRPGWRSSRLEARRRPPPPMPRPSRSGSKSWAASGEAGQSSGAGRPKRSRPSGSSPGAPRSPSRGGPFPSGRDGPLVAGSSSPPRAQHDNSQGKGA